MARWVREAALACSVTAARAALSQRGALGCFPGLTLAPGADSTTGRQELDLPYLGAESQDVVVEVNGGPGTGEEIAFGVRGALVSYRGAWRLDPDASADGARGLLSLESEASPAVVERAMNALRARSPLPFRTDADAILRRAVLDAFDERAEAHARSYAEAVARLLEGRA